jgi:hypothetical protein
MWAESIPNSGDDIISIGLCKQQSRLKHDLVRRTPPLWRLALCSHYTYSTSNDRLHILFTLDLNNFYFSDIVP